jgi:DNA repair protein RadC
MKRTKLYTRHKNGNYKEADRMTICETAAEYVEPIAGKSIRSPSDTESFLRSKLAHLPHELFCCIFLDNRHRIIKYEELFRGTIDGTSVYPREVALSALRCGAAAVILAHNHPSGVAEPSQADERISKRIKAGLELLDIRLLDHIIIGGRTATSCASRGIL